MFVLCLFYTTALWKPVSAIRVQCSGHVATDICKKSLCRSSSFHSTRPPSFCTSLSPKGSTFFHFIDTFIYIAMPSINKCFILFSLALSASALTTPHAIRHVNHHRAVAAALVATVPSPIVVPQGTRAVKAVRRRSNGGRCKATSSSATTAAPTPAANVEGAPPSRTGSSSSPDSTPKATPTSSSDQSSPSQKPASKQPASKQPATSSGGSGGNLPSYMEGTQTGQGTFYGTGLGACGITNNDNQHIAAVSELLFDTYPGYDGVNPNTNPLCGKMVTASYQGKSVQVALTDRCTACKITDLDFSPSAFNEIADPAVGRISGMTWVWDS